MALGAKCPEERDHPPSIGRTCSPWSGLVGLRGPAGHLALAISNSLLINLITNALMFVVLLPFYNMAEVIRAGLSHGLVTDLGRS